MTKATSSEWGIHPLAAVFPMMHGQDFDDFKADIEANGLREPLVVHEDQVLDGRNRYRACRELGIDPTFVDWDGKGSMLGFILSRNVQRRHMTEGQRVVTAARLAKLSRGRPAKNAQIRAISQDEAADLFKVGRTTVQAAKKVLDKGVPALVEAVERDEVRVSAAALVATLDRKEQARIAAEGPKAITAAAAQIRQADAAAKDDRQQPVAKGTDIAAKPSQTRQHEAESEAPRQAAEKERKVDGTSNRPRRQTEVEPPPARPGRSKKKHPIRADLPVPNRAKFDRMADFFERLQPVVDDFRRDYPEVDDEVRAMCSDCREPESLLGLALTASMIRIRAVPVKEYDKRQSGNARPEPQRGRRRTCGWSSRAGWPGGKAPSSTNRSDRLPSAHSGL